MGRSHPTQRARKAGFGRACATVRTRTPPVKPITGYRTVETGEGQSVNIEQTFLTAIEHRAFTSLCGLMSYLCGPERFTSRSARKTLPCRFAIHWRPLEV